jgi:hypothetical protein
MGSYFSHEHTTSCCLPNGQWCKKLDTYEDSSLHWALYFNIPNESDCLRILSEMETRHISSPGRKTLIHWAVYTQHVNLIEAAINRGIDINAVTKYGDTALYLAIMFQPIHAKCLIDHGANVNIINDLHQTSLLLAARKKNKHVCTLLLEAGANIIYPKLFPQNDETHSILVAYGLSFDAIPPDRLPQYLADSADAAFSRRKAAIRWWFWVHTQ